MYTITKTFKDYNGNEVTKDFLFNLNQAEIAEMELSTDGGFTDMVDRIIKAQDGPAIIKEFKKLLLKSYGEKSPDGQMFMKSEEISKRFEATPAYDIIFMELISDSDKASTFINGIIPKNANNTEENGLPKKINNPIPMPIK